MNPKFILPVSLALTAHVFLLFGLPGRPPVNGETAAVEPMPPDVPMPRLLIDEPIRVRGEPGDPEPPVDRRIGITPRMDDVVVTNPGLHDFVVPPLPRVEGVRGVDRISPVWVDERETPGGPGDRGWRAIDLDRVPRARVQPPPVYPGDMRNGGIEGSVVVEFLVDEAGNACNPVVVSSSRREFEGAALRAVARWKFEPGFKDGRRVRFHMSVPLVFKLDR